MIMRPRDIVLNLLLGALLFVCIALLRHPEVTGMQATWATYYGQF